MNFLFLNSSFIEERKDKIQTTSPSLRIGVSSMMACLREEGARVSLMDAQVENKSIEYLTCKIIQRQPDYLCLSSYTEEIMDAGKIAKSVKAQNPNIKTVVGGYHITAMPSETLQEFPDFDIGVVGEGEQPIVDILRGNALEKIPGVVYRENHSREIIINKPNNKTISLDDIPFPAWDLYDLKKYGDTIPIEPLRGCPFSCIFCFRALGRKVRYKSPDRIVDELQYCMKKYGINSFRFLAGTFPLSKKHATRIFEGIIAKRLNIKWTASCRVDCLDAELLKLMKKSGCQLLQLGIESGDSVLLKRCSKGITPDESIKTVRLCKTLGINVGLNFIIGLPFENHQSIRRTFWLSQRLRRYATSANFAILVPFPGTKTYDMALNNQGGLKLKTKDWSMFGKQSGFTLQHSNLSNSQLRRYQSLMYISYYILSPQKLFQENYFARALEVLKRLF